MTCAATTSWRWRASRSPTWRSRCPPPACASPSARSTPRAPSSRCASRPGARWRCPPTPTRPSELGYRYDQAVELLRSLGVERDRRLRGPRRDAWSRSGDRARRARLRLAPARGGPPAACSAASRSRRPSAASTATPTPTSSPTRSSTRCWARPRSATSATHFPDTDPRYAGRGLIELLGRGARPAGGPRPGRGQRRRDRGLRAPEARPVPRGDARSPGRARPASRRRAST